MRFRTLAPLLTVLGACADLPQNEGVETSEAAACVPGVVLSSDLRPERSLAITDPNVVGSATGPFRLEGVLRQLARQANPSLTDTTAAPVALDLYRQWWATFDVTAGDTTRPHCDSPDPRVLAGFVGPSFNGFPWACPRGERLNQDVPMANWRPTALFYRPDLMPTNFANCGEARIVYHRDFSTTAIFEAKIRNPTPGCIEGCRRVAQFWADFSTERVNGLPLDALTIQSRLFAFYMTGTAIPGLGPIIHIDNFSGSSGGAYAGSSGQVRTNVISDFPWELKEFAVRRLGTTNARRIELRPQTDKVNPSPLLFANMPVESGPTADDLRARMSTFRTQFINGDVEKLAFGDINTFTMAPLDTANAGVSRSGSGDFQNPNTNYSQQAGNEMRALIQARIDVLRARAVRPLVNASITPDVILARATAMSCSGCHFNSNNAFIGDTGPGGPTRWPADAGFVHVSFSQGGRDINGGSSGFFLSNALTQVFLPARQNVLASFLTATRCPTCPSPSPSPSASPSFASQESGLASSPSASPSASPSSSPSPSPSFGPEPWSETIGGRTVH